MISNVVQAVQQGDTTGLSGSPVNPIAEAVRGLARDRSVAMRKLEANTCRADWPEFRAEWLQRIAEIDARIDRLLAMGDAPERKGDD